MEYQNNAGEILYIEDDVVDIESLKRQFKKVNENIKIVIANDGVEALDMLLGRHGKEKLTPTPKVILLDINLPKMDGIEFLETLRASPTLEFIQVFIVTSAYDTHRKVAMHDLNVSGWIVKPLEYSDALAVYWALMA